MIMIDLNLSVLNENQIPDIIVRPYEYSYDELIDIINEQDDEMLMMDFDKYCDTFDKEFNDFENILILNTYISNHGIDQAVEELFGSNEGFIDGVKNAIVSFVKWLCKKLKELCSWIKKLFTSTTDKSKNTPTGIVMKLCDATPSHRKEMLEKIKNSSNTSFVTSEYDLEQLEALVDANKGICGDGKLFYEIRNNYDEYRTAFSRMSSIKSGQRKYNLTEACSFLLTMSETLTDIRATALFAVQKLERAAAVKLPDKLDQKGCSDYCKKICDIFDIVSRNDVKNETMYSLKALVKSCRLYAAYLARIDRLCIAAASSVLSQMVLSANITSDHTSYGAVEVKVPFPASFANRIKDGYGRDKLLLKRIVVSSIRLGDNTKGKSAGTGAVGRSANATAGAHEIYINFNKFIDAIGERRREKDTAAVHKEYGLDDVPINANNVDAMIRTIVHEARHVYQFQNDKHTADVRKPINPALTTLNDRYADYAKREHEVDARRVAREFKITDEDRKFIIDVFKKCIACRNKNIIKYKK